MPDRHAILVIDLLQRVAHILLAQDLEQFKRARQSVHVERRHRAGNVRVELVRQLGQAEREGKRLHSVRAHHARDAQHRGRDGALGLHRGLELERAYAPARDP